MSYSDFLSFISYPSYAYNFSSQMILLQNVFSYIKYFVLSYSIDVISTQSWY